MIHFSGVLTHSIRTRPIFVWIVYQDFNTTPCTMTLLPGFFLQNIKLITKQTFLNEELNLLQDKLLQKDTEYNKKKTRRQIFIFQIKVLSFLK